MKQTAVCTLHPSAYGSKFAEGPPLIRELSIRERIPLPLYGPAEVLLGPYGWPKIPYWNREDSMRSPPDKISFLKTDRLYRPYR